MTFNHFVIFLGVLVAAAGFAMGLKLLKGETPAVLRIPPIAKLAALLSEPRSNERTPRLRLDWVAIFVGAAITGCFLMWPPWEERRSGDDSWHRLSAPAPIFNPPEGRGRWHEQTWREIRVAKAPLLLRVVATCATTAIVARVLRSRARSGIDAVRG